MNDIEKHVKFYVKGLFRGFDETSEIAEQREEIEAHLCDHIADLTEQGMDEEAAFEKAVGSLGDLNDLVDVITRRKARVKFNRLKMFFFLSGAVYGTLYAIGVAAQYLAWNGRVGYVIGGLAFFGYFVPFLPALARFLRNPDRVEVVVATTRKDVVTAIEGWLAISAACALGNLATFLLKAPGWRPFWSWLPLAGSFAWPLMSFVAYKLFRSKTCTVE